MPFKAPGAPEAIIPVASWPYLIPLKTAKNRINLFLVAFLPARERDYGTTGPTFAEATLISCWNEPKAL